MRSNTLQIEVMTPFSSRSNKIFEISHLLENQNLGCCNFWHRPSIPYPSECIRLGKSRAFQSNSSKAFRFHPNSLKFSNIWCRFCSDHEYSNQKWRIRMPCEIVATIFSQYSSRSYRFRRDFYRPTEFSSRRALNSLHFAVFRCIEVLFWSPMHMFPIVCGLVHSWNCEIIVVNHCWWNLLPFWRNLIQNRHNLRKFL